MGRKGEGNEREYNKTNADGGGCCCSGGCTPDVGRRDFLKVAGAGLLSFPALLQSLPASAGSMVDMPIMDDHKVPANKGLKGDWVRSLYERGVPEVYRGKELDTIGMPVGGIAAGQIYLLGDGRLGVWQIFNKRNFTGYGATNWQYRTPEVPVEQGFAVIAESDGKRMTKRLNREDFPDVEFQGEYPIGRVRYSADEFPVKIEMEAFSPFIPLDTKNSTLPVTMFNITVENTSEKAVRAAVLGWLENAACFHNATKVDALRRSRIERARGKAMIVHSVEESPKATTKSAREPIVFEDFEGKDYGDWEATGTAFGAGPAKGTLPRQQEVSGFLGEGLVNTFIDGDKPQGTLTSPEFTISRNYINFLIGGGKHENQTCINLLVDGKVARTQCGVDNEQLTWHGWRVADLEGKKARLQIVDKNSGGWGHVNLDQIEFSDELRAGTGGSLEELEDYGEMILGYAGPAADLEETKTAATSLNGLPGNLNLEDTTAYPIHESKCTGMLTSAVKIPAGCERTFTFALVWYFPNHEHGHEFTNRFKSAGEIADYILDNHRRLSDETRRWHDVYYDSTLPYWLLNRLHSTISNVATGTTQYWKNGRFWAWEGVGCCQGTCTHVWNYAHGLARLFPELERSAREMQDLGSALHENGLVGFRGERNGAYAADGQAGTVLKCYREHQMSPDDSFLKRNWEKIKKVLGFSIEQDGDDDGLIVNSQHNTFDINFFGPNTFVGSLYLAALRAAEEMALDMGDTAYAGRLRKIFESGSRLSVERLWNGEYFVQVVDLKEHPKFQYAGGCLSDQMFGQGWAHQLRLGYIYPKTHVHKTLDSIWKYNWAPDVAPQNEIHKPERWFITPGEPGLFTCTWPKTKFLSEGVRYRNEIWTGIEYQVAGHMVWDGMVDEAMVMCRAIHDRYHPSTHNPWNEIECGDHYARALASWGVFTALAGYEYHGPKGYLGFAPRVSPENFRAAFTAAEGWGSYDQKRDGDKQTSTVEVAWGCLRLKTLALEVPMETGGVDNIRVTIGDEPISASLERIKNRLAVVFADPITLAEGDRLTVEVS